MQESRYAIRVHELSKRYDLGNTVDLARNFRETLASLPGWLGNRSRRQIQKTRDAAGDNGEGGVKDWIWALHNINFDVEPGEAVGIIGRNGSGKSTLLKILSQVTTPTEGRAEIYGRVGSLLEVGTGFHPELSGRDNIFLNGAILGMRKAEITRKFDEIVDFAGVGKFLDTPVKRYSSGMRVRLAFAVSAHLEPEVLVIDEVLAVGDQEFQNKCLGKMQNVAGNGRTVLFVSHNMQAIKQLCQRGIVLKSGEICFEGSAQQAVEKYLELNEPDHVVADIAPEMHSRPHPGLEIFRIEIIDSKGVFNNTLSVGESFTVNIDYRIHEETQKYRIGIVFQSHDAVRLATCVNTADNRSHLKGRQGRTYRQSVTFVNPFLPGHYQMEFTVKNHVNGLVDQIQGIPVYVAAVSVENSDRIAAGGYFHIQQEWQEPIEIG